MKLKIKLAFAAVLLIFYAAAHADEWRGPDKVLHAKYSFAYGLGASLVVNKPDNFIVPFGLAMVPGVIKEWQDSHRAGGSGWSNRDLVADALGAATGVAVGNRAMFYITRRNDETCVNMAASF